MATQGNQRENVSMTVLSRRDGTDHPLLRYLPAFTCSKDRAVVLNLLCNVSGLCVDGYRDISRRSGEEIRSLAERGVQLQRDTGGCCKLSFRDAGLFAVDVKGVLLSAVGILHLQDALEAVSEIQVR